MLARLCLRVALVAALIGAVPNVARAGGVGFGDDDDNNGDDGPSYFGFVREVDGPGVSDAKVTASLKDRGALVTRSGSIMATRPRAAAIRIVVSVQPYHNIFGPSPCRPAS